MPMMRDINVMFSLLVVVDSVDHFARCIRVISPTALFQFFRLNFQLRVFIQLKKLFLDFLYYLRSCAAFVVFAHFNSQHLFLLEVIKQIRTRQQIQRTN
ncbi:Uncharacterised protein [Shigella sonnei]|nr:Uncharacterised protein [Shigella sonnei]